MKKNNIVLKFAVKFSGMTVFLNVYDKDVKLVEVDYSDLNFEDDEFKDYLNRNGSEVPFFHEGNMPSPYEQL